MMNWKISIHSDPNILLGKHVVKGTRLSVEFILGLFFQGWTEGEILESYPTLDSNSIQAVFAFAAEVTVNSKNVFDDQFTAVDRDQIRQRSLP